jgi:starch synthase
LGNRRLADVLGALPPAWRVSVARNGGVAAVSRRRGGPRVGGFPLTIGGQRHDVTLYQAPLDGALAVLIDIPAFFDRDELYGAGSADYPDNARRFAFLARAALEYAAQAPSAFSVIHAHDWQAGLAPVYLKTRFSGHATLGAIPSVFTIHNLAYQGLFETDWLPRLDLSWDLLGIDALEFWGRISFLKAGINYSQLITTVSPRYAQEIQTPEFGFGFDGILRRRTADLFGVLNGIDTGQWNPATDPHLPAPLRSEDCRASAAKIASCRSMAWPWMRALSRPLVGMISRMVDQGFDLSRRFRPRSRGWMRRSSPRHRRTAVGLLGRPRRLHRERIGGASASTRAGAPHRSRRRHFLMPSRFEPCGLTRCTHALRHRRSPAVSGLAIRSGPPPVVPTRPVSSSRIPPGAPWGLGARWLFQDPGMRDLSWWACGKTILGPFSWDASKYINERLTFGRPSISSRRRRKRFKRRALVRR